MNTITLPEKQDSEKTHEGGAATAEDDMSAHSGTSFDGHPEHQAAKHRCEEIARRESRMVSRLRFLVFAVLVTSAVAVSVIVNLYVTNQQQTEFETKFDSDAIKVFEAVGRTLDQTLGSTDAFVLQLLQHEKYSSDTAWPLVTLPGFPQQAGKLLKLSKAFFCSLAVLVKPNERVQWESYAQENSAGWLNEALAVQAKDTSAQDPGTTSSFAYMVPQKIFGFQGPFGNHTHITGNYYPQWQHYPLRSGGGGVLPINWDNLVVPSAAAAISDAVDQKRIAIAPASNIITPQAAAESEMAMSLVENGRNWAAQYISPDENKTEPFASMWVPMLDVATESVQVDLTDDGDQAQESKAVGFFTYWFFWNKFFRDVLPNDSNGILVVLSNPCGPSFTYRLDGPSETYLGVGDMHDEAYDYLGQAKTLTDVMEATEGSRSYVGIPLSETHCTHTIHVYPTSDMKDNHVTNDPIYFTFGAAAIFIFTSTIFLLYDCTVARRQRIVMERALASGAIVQGLFPEAVRNQLYEQQKREQAKEDAVKSFKNFPDNDKDDNLSRPIAEVFPETTIFFADIAGFTAWSNNRSPTQVFELLEALYGAFDKIALRRGVFKVETIGDSYVAVTGLPKPQQNHAVIMVKFAREVLEKLDQITQDLVESLGEDTANLGMRVGLHTGSTTAGVLRGDKGRYQIFGDSVNTASRMESTGQVGCIHVSQDTAGALISSGKTHWLKEREDMIKAKGKGVMTTYFVTVNTETNSYSRSSFRTRSLHDDNSDVDKVSGTFQQRDGDIED